MKQSDIGDILHKLAFSDHWARSKLVQVLCHLSRAGVPLETCADGRHLDRAISTLKRYACRFDLTFPDYTPRHLKPKRAKAA